METKFKLIEGSDYQIIDSHKVVYKIGFEQFKKTMTLLFDAGVDFITINNVILNKRFIYKIEPVIKKVLSTEEIAEKRYYSQRRSSDFKSMEEVLLEVKKEIKKNV